MDDLGFTTPANWFANNVALSQPASADSQQAGNPPGNGNDGNNGTRWSANYIFKRSAGSGGEVSIGSTTNTVYADTGLTNGTTYYYVVAAQNLLGQSGNSAEVAATPQPPVPGSYAATLVADHPLAYWPLNETNGTAAYDLVGGHNGTYVGGVTLGQPGVPLAGFITPDYAALFNGTSGYVDIPEGPFNITGVITMVAWINVPVAPGFSDIIGHGDGSWCMSVDASGQPGGSDGNVGDATGSASIVGAGWKMVAFTYTGVNTGNNGSLYVNGTLVAQNTVSTTPAGNAYDVWIGSAPDYVGRGLPGSIAHAAVFNTALSPTQVRALNNASLVASPVTLKIAPAGSGGLTFNWLEGTLLQATNVAGPWTTNPAASPYTTAPTNAQMYFKVRVN